MKGDSHSWLVPHPEMQPKYEISTNFYRIKLFILGAKLYVYTRALCSSELIAQAGDAEGLAQDYKAPIQLQQIRCRCLISLGLLRGQV